MELEISQYILPEVAIVVVALWVLGYFLKSTPLLPNWLIGWILMAAGIAATSAIMLEISIHSVIQGVLTSWIAVGGHQLFKQTTEKKEV